MYLSCEKFISIYLINSMVDIWRTKIVLQIYIKGNHIIHLLITAQNNCITCHCILKDIGQRYTRGASIAQTETHRYKLN